MKSHQLPPATAASVLEEASARNQSLDLMRLLESGEDACRSRFIQVPGARLGIEVPSRRGHLVPVRPGEDVEVFFRQGDRRYWFASSVVSRDAVRLSGEMDVPVLIIERPERVELRQRRRHFRVRLPIADRMMADLWPADGPRQKPAFSLEVLDISAGGLRLLYNLTEACPLKVADRLLARLPLDRDAEPVSVAVEVRHAGRVGDANVQMGLVFTDLDETPEGRQLRNQFQRFVAQREREELRRMHGRT